MIQGLIPLIFLWALVLGSLASWVLINLTRWWQTLVGQVLWFYIGATFWWWALILLGSYIQPPQRMWLAYIQIALLGLKAVGVIWMAVLMYKARHHRDEQQTTTEDTRA